MDNEETFEVTIKDTSFSYVVKPIEDYLLNKIIGKPNTKQLQQEVFENINNTLKNNLDEIIFNQLSWEIRVSERTLTLLPKDEFTKQVFMNFTRK